MIVETRVMAFTEEVEQALVRYFESGSTGDVNAYLDELGLDHQRIIVGKSGDVHQGAVQPRYPGCPYGYHAVPTTVYNKHSGLQTTWSCVPS